MRIVILPFLFLCLFSLAQNIPSTSHSAGKSTNAHPFLMVRTEQSEGLEIIKRVNKDFVIVRNDSNLRLNDATFYEVNDDWKWADYYPTNTRGEFYVSIDINPSSILNKLKLIQYDAQSGFALIDGSLKHLKSELLEHPRVTYIQKKSRGATAESSLREHNLGLNNIRFVHKIFTGIKGSDMDVSIKEQAFDTLDIDINRRSTRDILSDDFVVGHATDMATLVAGAGNSFLTGQGVAPNAQLYSESFDNLFPASNSNFTVRGISVQNHSYGVGIENFYGLESVAFDQQAQDLPYLFHVFSAGNSGNQNGSGMYAGLSRYGTLTGSFKQAKNVLLVTSSDELGNVLTANSAGPAYDGRIKPDLSAFGKGGTSDAAALVSGASVLIQEFYLDLYLESPKGEVTKAILIAGSNDVGASGPDFFGGYGQLNLKKSMDIIENNWLIEGSLTNQESQSHQVTVDTGIKQLTVVLAWRDPSANNGDGISLINDLDMKAVLNGDEWLPWILDSSPNMNALSAAATRGVDHLNNVEVIRIDNPNPGTYTIDVTGFDVIGSQEYAIAYFLESTDEFTWTYPTSLDPQEAGTVIQLYFDNTYDIPGTLEWDNLSGNWTSAGTINPETRNLAFTLPEMNGEVVLRTTFGPNEIKSDTFAVGVKPQLKVALFCDDELVVNWEKTSENGLYELLNYQNGTLVSKQIASDTFAIINRSETAGLFFTVREIGTYSNGVPDETIRVDQQGIGCYLNNFLVSLDQFETVNLVANISLPQFLETLRILKIDADDSVVFASISPSQTVHSFTDSNLSPGMTSYYLQLITKNGAEILSEKFSLFTTNDKKYILFPNPVVDGFINLLSPEPNAVFQILQLDGKPVREFVMGAKFESFLIDLSKGTYLYRVLKGNEVLKSGKFVVGS